MNYSDLKILIDSKKIDVYSLSNEIGMTYDGFRLSIKNETIQLHKLKKLCEVLKINPMLFFENMQGMFIDDGTTKINSTERKLLESKENEIQYLKQRVSDKDEIIGMLRDKIDMLNQPVTIAAKPHVEYKNKK
jgi:DNA-binding Xre family transcriptional regulator